jgi:CelD/BcsL family acetyltransferase involved in cellulose biosynthesis
MSPLHRDPLEPATDGRSPVGDDLPEVAVHSSIEPLAEEWDEFGVRTKASPFARPGWIAAWWTAFGRGEPFVLSARRDGVLTAVLPLARHRGRLKSCSNVHSPVFDGVASEPEDLRSLLAAAMGQTRHRLLLGQIDTAGHLAAAIREIADESRHHLLELDAATAAYIDPVVDWERYESQMMTKKRRQDLRRRSRRLSELGEVEVEVTVDSTDLDTRLSEFFWLEGSGWKVDMGTAIHQVPATRRFYEEMAHWAAENGLLRLVTMRLDHRPIAGQLIIDDESRRHLLKIGYDPEYSRFGPGLLLQLREIRSALEDGRTYELGTGMSAIKREMGNAERTIQQVALFPRSVRGAVARRTAATRQAVYRQARESGVLRRGRDTVRRGLGRLRSSPADNHRPSLGPSPRRATPASD